MSRPRVTKGERRHLLSVGACGRLTKQQGVILSLERRTSLGRTGWSRGKCEQSSLLTGRLVGQGAPKAIPWGQWSGPSGPQLPALLYLLEETPETPPSSRAEGLLFLHGMESNPGCVHSHRYVSTRVLVEGALMTAD